MGLLTGKKALIFGVANERSIAWGISQALHREGAELGFTFLGEALEKRVRPLAESVGSKLILPCDVQDDAQIEAVYAGLGKAWGKFDILVHAVAYAKKEDLEGRYVDTLRANWHLAFDISAYSLVAVTRPALPYLNADASVMTMTYNGGDVVSPNYNVMGVAKAALESSMRYLAADLGPQGVRVNAISAGPIKTLSAAGVGGFRKMLARVAQVAPLRRNVTTEDVGKAATFLCSDLASGVTGEILYVDNGFSHVGMSFPEDGAEE